MPEQPPDAFPPGSRQIRDGQVAFDHGQLEFEAQNDVQRVGQRVGRDADQRRFDRDQRPVELAGATRKPASARSAASTPAKAGMARDVVLPQLALGLVDRHRGAAAEVRPLQCRVYLALVEGVAVLVQGAEQRLDPAVVVAGRDTRVPRTHPGGEGVRRDIDPPAGSHRRRSASGSP